MSTLAACRADNFYRPADYDPNTRKKEVEKRRRLGKVKDRKQGAKKIRFEMPFHVRCEKCSHMIAKGVRFNAIKKKAGRYLGTIIFEFAMPCPSCKSYMVIKTNPQTTEFDLISGVKKYEVDYNEEDLGMIKIQNPEEGEQLNKNPLLKLEVQKIDFLKGEEMKPVLARLVEERKVLKNDFFLNQTLRRKLKMEKAVIKKEEEELKTEKNFTLPLLEHSIEDDLLAHSVDFKKKNLTFKMTDKKRLESIMAFKQPKVRNPSSHGSNKESLIKNSNPRNFVEKSSKNFMSSISINPSNAKINEINNLIAKKHKMDIGLQRSLEREIRKDILKADSSSIFKRMERTENGLILSGKTFLKKKKIA